MAKPVFSVKVGAISLAVWENEFKKDGKTLTTQSITITRTYKKGDSFDTTNSLRFNDLPLVEVAIQKAMEYKYLKASPESESEF